METNEPHQHRLPRPERSATTGNENSRWDKEIREIDDLSEIDIATSPTPAPRDAASAARPSAQAAPTPSATRASTPEKSPKNLPVGFANKLALSSDGDADRPSGPTDTGAERASRATGRKRPRHALNAGVLPNWLGRLLEWASVVAIALTISLLIRTLLFQAFWIPSSSMEETLQIGDNVAATPLAPMVGDIERGDVVVFQDTLGWLPPPPERSGLRKYFNEGLVFLGLRPAPGDQHLVKRVIGLPGDHVTCKAGDNHVYVNGVAINEPYLAPGSNNGAVPFDITVPAGHLWVMGDNRNHSADSRMHPSSPFVPISAVVGKVVWVTWPVSHWSNPTDNDAFDAVPESAQ